MRWTYDNSNYWFQLIADLGALVCVLMIGIVAWAGFGWGAVRVANLTDASIGVTGEAWVTDEPGNRVHFVVVNHGEQVDLGDDFVFEGSASSPFIFYTKSYVGNKTFSYEEILDACRNNTKWQDFGITDDVLKGKMYLYFSGGNYDMYQQFFADVYSDNYLELKQQIRNGDASNVFVYFGLKCNKNSSYYELNTSMPDVGINVDIYRKKGYEGELPINLDFTRLCEVNALDKYTG